MKGNKVMKPMKEYAYDFQMKHPNMVVSNVTNYSFKATTVPKKEDEKPRSWVYMKSWFLKL